MKFLLFIDKYYSKIRYFFLLVNIPIIVAVIYLYIHLPTIIPVHFGHNLEVSSIGNKATIFSLPILLTFFSLPLSQKYFITREPVVNHRALYELLFIVVFILVSIVIVSVLYIYFKMI